MGTTIMNSVTIDGVEYAPVKKVTGNRAVVIVDRGWIFAGDVTRENGRIKLARAINVQRWEGIGFPAMIENPLQQRVVIKPVADVEIPDGAEIFSVPVPETWGIK